MHYLKLGASLYIPAIHKDLINVAKGLKYPNLKSLIVDMEDSVDESDLAYAYHALQRLLPLLEPDNQARPLIFVRMRNAGEFENLKRLRHIERVDGFVLPKFSSRTMREYMDQLMPGKWYMPILEKDVFAWHEIETICAFLRDYQAHVLSVRIGANDLLGSLNLRRDCRTVIYEIGMMSTLISHIVLNFRQHGFNVTGPVYECFTEASREVLRRETELDLLNGLFGKTIVHPSQIDVVQELYKVSRADYNAAKRLLDPYSPAVFQLNQQMHEKATHLGWAQTIEQRAALYGVREIG
jgi:citrate lyase beta subunit